MLGRGKKDEPTSTAVVEAPKPGGKGRPTPRRAQAQAANRRPLVADPRVAAARTKEERKALRDAQRAAAREERQRVRVALLTNDEANLPARDRGPVRRWVRDYVDARRNPGEFFLPAALVVVLLSVFPDPRVLVASTVVLYGMVATCVVDAVLLRRKLNRELAQRFSPQQVHGAASYGMMRAFQIRRTRLPKPVVSRGQFPR